MNESRNVYDLLGKIEWEGGMLELITSYGKSSIDDYDVPDQLKERWEEISTVLGSVSEDIDDLYQDINSYATKYGNKEEEDDDY